MSDPQNPRLEINGVDITDLLREPSGLFQKINCDSTPVITVSPEQFRLIADADREAGSRLGYGSFDEQYFKTAIENILSEADMKLLACGTARLVVTQL
jgi:hypothetical protein